MWNEEVGEVGMAQTSAEWLAERVQTVREWAQVSLIQLDGNVIRGTVLYQDYTEWMKSREPASRTVWGTYMGRHYNKARYSGVYVYRGIALKSDKGIDVSRDPMT